MLDTSKISPAWSRIVPAALVADRGEGACLFTRDGRRFLDFTSGIGVTSTGHAHPRVVEAIQRQAARLIHGQINITFHEPVLRLSDELASVVPRGLDCFFFANSGAEIIEVAVKTAKHATGRPNVIVFSGSFHGRTHLAMSLTTSKTVYRAGYQPLVPGVFVAPFPYAYRYGWDDETTTDFCLRELDFLLRSQTAPGETAAVLLEPVLGEGGYVVPPVRFVRELREVCDRYGMLLIADEIQTGFGRTGAWFCLEHYGVIPDIICMAKGMASGMPISAMAAAPELAAKQPPGAQGGTYGANAVACAAAIATIQTIREEKLVENAHELGPVLLDGLRRLQKKHPEIGDVRGLGLMVGTEFTSPDGKPWPERTKQVQNSAFEGGLLLITCGTHGNVIRWIPPLVVSSTEIEQALTIFGTALAQG